MEKKVVYFERPGKENTPACIDITRETVEAYGYRHIVVATTTGDTGYQFSETFRGSGINLVAITHSYGFRDPNTIEISDDMKRRIAENGAFVYTGTMITHNLETAFASKFQGLYPTTIVAQTLRRFGEGAKVCCEIAMMAADAGLIPEGEEVITVAGTGRGADTVAVVRAATSKRFLDLRVLEILAKPRL